MEITCEKLIAAGLAGRLFVACWIDGGFGVAFLLTLYVLLLPLAMIWFDRSSGD
jgi:hypothetical protein